MRAGAGTVSGEAGDSHLGNLETWDSHLYATLMAPWIASSYLRGTGSTREVRTRQTHPLPTMVYAFEYE